MSQYKTGNVHECPICRKAVDLNPDGTVKTHYADANGGGLDTHSPPENRVKPRTRRLGTKVPDRGSSLYDRTELEAAG